MMTLARVTVAIVMFAALTLSHITQAANAQALLTTAFTYQGQLTQSGTPASGPHDLRFELYDAALGGLPIGGIAQCFNDIPVTNGRFTVTLDFGDVFDGSKRFLQVQVRSDLTRTCPDLAGFVTLGPRQELTIAPNAGYALRSLDSSLLGGFSPFFYTNATNLSSGILADARLPSSIPRLAAANTFSQSNTFNGTFTGIRRNTRVNASEVFGIQGNDDGVLNNFTGMYVRSNFANGQPYYALTTSSGAAAFIYFNGAEGTLKINNGLDRVTITNSGNVGIGTSIPDTALEVRGDISLGPTGTLRVPAGEENLRIIRGRVSSSGTVNSGTGFTVSRLSEGLYRITYTRPFNAAPVVTVTNQTLQASSNSTPSFSANVVDVQTYNAAGALNDTAFAFIAIGPR